MLTIFIILHHAYSAFVVQCEARIVAVRRTRPIPICIQYACSNTAIYRQLGNLSRTEIESQPCLAIALYFLVALHDTKLLLQTVENVDCSIIVLFLALSFQ